MSALIHESEAFDQAVPARRTYRSQDELDMRDAVDLWGRTKCPDARQVHELVMDRGKVRSDMALIQPAHFVAIELKSEWDSLDRLMLQAAMFRLASPELWVVCHERFLKDLDAVRYLIPTLGVMRATREPAFGGPFGLEIIHAAEPHVPCPTALLSLCWVAELHAEAVLARLCGPKAPTHARLVAMMERLSPAEQMAAVCRQLRKRNALWRADPPITD